MVIFVLRAYLMDSDTSSTLAQYTIIRGVLKLKGSPEDDTKFLAFAYWI